MPASYSALMRGTAVRDPAADLAVDLAQVLDFLIGFDGPTLRGHAKRVDEWSQRGHFLGYGTAISFHDDELGHRDTGCRRCFAACPVLDGATLGGHFVRGVVAAAVRRRDLACAEMLLGQFGEPAGQRVEGVEVAAGLPRRRGRRSEGAHEPMHVRRGQVADGESDYATVPLSRKMVQS